MPLLDGLVLVECLGVPLQGLGDRRTDALVEKRRLVVLDGQK